MQRQYKKRWSTIYWLGMVLSTLLLVACGSLVVDQTRSPTAQETTAETISIQDLDISSGQTVFVPAYSEVYYASNKTIALAVTLSIHNTDVENSIFITSVRYYNTQGQLVKEYLTEPQRLDALASADFFVNSGEQTGGVGTNFIVEWVAEQPVYEPVVETLMLSTSSAQGLSFTSPGRVISQLE